MYYIRGANKNCSIYCTSSFIEIIFMQCVNRLHKNRQKKKKSIMRVGKEVLRRRRAGWKFYHDGVAASRADAFTLRKQRRYRYAVNIASQRPVTLDVYFQTQLCGRPRCRLGRQLPRRGLSDFRACTRFDSNNGRRVLSFCLVFFFRLSLLLLPDEPENELLLLFFNVIFTTCLQLHVIVVYNISTAVQL